MKYTFFYYSEWIHDNSMTAKDKYESTEATRDQVKTLMETLCKSYGIKQVRNAYMC